MCCTTTIWSLSCRFLFFLSPLKLDCWDKWKNTNKLLFLFFGFCFSKMFLCGNEENTSRKCTTYIFILPHHHHHHLTFYRFNYHQLSRREFEWKTRKTLLVSSIPRLPFFVVVVSPRLCIHQACPLTGGGTDAHSVHVRDYFTVQIKRWNIFCSFTHFTEEQRRVDLQLKFCHLFFFLNEWPPSHKDRQTSNFFFILNGSTFFSSRNNECNTHKRETHSIIPWAATSNVFNVPSI